jgi:hypothetical protein
VKVCSARVKVRLITAGKGSVSTFPPLFAMIKIFQVCLILSTSLYESKLGKDFLAILSNARHDCININFTEKFNGLKARGSESLDRFFCNIFTRDIACGMEVTRPFFGKFSSNHICIAR